MCRGWALKKTTVCAFLLLYISQTTLAKLLFIHNFSSNFRPVGGRKKTSERRGKLQKSFNLENMGEGGTTLYFYTALSSKKTSQDLFIRPSVSQKNSWFQINNTYTQGFRRQNMRRLNSKYG